MVEVNVQDATVNILLIIPYQYLTLFSELILFFSDVQSVASSTQSTPNQVSFFFNFPLYM